MIYIDVTSSCKSPMNTGVQRVVRGLFRSISKAAGKSEEVIPVLWEPRLESYCRLSRRERGFLERPFAKNAACKALAEPGRMANRVPIWSKVWRQMQHRRSQVDLLLELKKNDTVFVPEIFQDNRLEWFHHLSKRTDARLVAVCHDAIGWRRPEITPPARRERFGDYLEALVHFDGVIAVSHEAADDLQAYWKARGHWEKCPEVNVLGWPVDDHFSVPTKKKNSKKEASEVSEVSTKVPQILCVGTLEPRKNHLTLLYAAESLWQKGLNFELVFVGRTTAQFGKQVLSEVERLQGQDRPVVWRRHVDDEKLQQAYQECTFTVFPSIVEGYGLPIVESLRHHRPCVCGSNGAIGELASQGGCYTVDQKQIGSLAYGMEQLLTDPNLYQKLRTEAEQRQFESWQDYLNKLLPFLQVSPKALVST